MKILELFQSPAKNYSSTRFVLILGALWCTWVVGIWGVISLQTGTIQDLPFIQFLTAGVFAVIKGYQSDNETAPAQQERETANE